MELFRDLHAQGMTLILVTHDPGVAAYAPRVITFQDGKIIRDTGIPGAGRTGTDRSENGVDSGTSTENIGSGPPATTDLTAEST
jgi:energy-coupling factor transporter ATP-binding protein EcfA2